MSKWTSKKMGVLLIIFGGLINVILLQNNINGLVRESTRFSVLAGVALVVVSLVQKFKAR